MFPKKGKFFPDREGRPGTEIRFATVVGSALRDELRGTRHSAKTIMEWTGASERTVKNWLAKRSSPSAPHLVCLMRHSKKVLDAVLQAAGREQHVLLGMDLAAARNLMAAVVRRLDDLLAHRR
jgi:hypothetical protein